MARGGAAAWSERNLHGVAELSSVYSSPPVLDGLWRAIRATPAMDGFPDPLVERVLVANVWLRRRQRGDRVTLSLAAEHDGWVSLIGFGDATAFLARSGSCRRLLEPADAFGVERIDRFDVAHVGVSSGDVVILASATLARSLTKEAVASIACDDRVTLDERCERLVDGAGLDASDARRLPPNAPRSAVLFAVR